MRCLAKAYECRDEANDFRLDYGPQLNRSLEVLEEALAGDSRASGYDPRWLAVRLIAGDNEISRIFAD